MTALQGKKGRYKPLEQIAFQTKKAFTRSGVDNYVVLVAIGTEIVIEGNAVRIRPYGRRICVPDVKREAGPIDPASLLYTDGSTTSRPCG